MYMFCYRSKIIENLSCSSVTLSLFLSLELVTSASVRLRDVGFLQMNPYY